MALSKDQLRAERTEASTLVSALSMATIGEGSPVSALNQATAFSLSHPGRGPLLLREAGVLQVSVRLFNTRGTGELAVLASIQLLKELVLSFSGAQEFAAYGGHGSLMRVMGAAREESIIEALDDFLGEISGVATEAGVPFPTLTSRVLEEGENIFEPLLEYDFHKPGDGEENTSSTMTVLVQAVSERQESQFTVGYLMWPAAVILGRWLRCNEGLFQGKSVHELGAGLGLSGLVACAAASSVVLSDFNPRVSPSSAA